MSKSKARILDEITVFGNVIRTYKAPGILIDTLFYNQITDIFYKHRVSDLLKRIPEGKGYYLIFDSKDLLKYDHMNVIRIKISFLSFIQPNLREKTVVRKELISS